MELQTFEICARVETNAMADANDGVWAEAQIRQTVGADCVGLECFSQE